MSVIRPLPWLSRGYHAVDVLSSIGYQSVQSSINHSAKVWFPDTQESEVQNALIANEYVFRWLREGASLPPAALIPVLFSFSVLEPSSRPVPLMTSHDLMNWWACLIDRTVPGIKTLSTLLNSPYFLVKTGYSLLREEFFESPDDSHELGACLSMIGAGALAVFTSQPCNLCKIRRSVAGTLRCRACSRSKRVIDPADMQSQAAHANRVRRIRVNSTIQDMSVSENHLSSCTRSIASLLFGMDKQSPQHLEWLSHINDSLDKAPTIKNMLGSEFHHADFQFQTQALRSTIDENEWDYGLWSEKILQAQSWYDAADIVQKRRRGPGPMSKTIELAEQAQKLFQQGSSKKAIALQLGVSLSHLSHILRRVTPPR